MANNEQEDPEFEMLNENYPHHDLSFKIIVIGNPNVGKSCLSVQATKKTFDFHQNSVGVEYYVFNMRTKEKVIKLQIWDTCGQELYRSLISNFYKNSSLAIIVYAIDE